MAGASHNVHLVIAENYELGRYELGLRSDVVRVGPDKYENLNGERILLVSASSKFAIAERLRGYRFLSMTTFGTPPLEVESEARDWFAKYKVLSFEDR